MIDLSMRSFLEKRLLIIITAVVILVVAFAIAFSVYKNASPSPQVTSPSSTAELSQETGALLGTAKLQLPLIEKSVPAAAASSDASDFMLPGSVGAQYGTLTYAGSQGGFSARYLLSSSTAQDAWSQVMQLRTTSKWASDAGGSAEAYAFLEYTKIDSSSQARIAFIQQNNGVLVVVQTLTLKK